MIPEIRLNDGNKMPMLGLGTWQMRWAVDKAVQSAIEAGYRLIDTATIYNNEHDIGDALRKIGIDRKEVFITTKIWNDDHKDPRGAIETSLKKLGVEYVDLYLIHWPVEGRLDTWKTLQDFQEEGLCRSIGVCNFTIRHLQELLRESKKLPVVNQVEFNPFLYQKELLEFCQSKNIALEAYSPLGRAKKLDNKTIAEIAKKHNKSPAQIMLRWSVQKGVIVIPKSGHPERVKENADIFGFALTEEEMQVMDGLNENFRTCWDPSDIP